MGNLYNKSDDLLIKDIYILKDNIYLIKHNEDIVMELSKSSIFVMPSRYEGYANALVEALACGIPSITYNWLLGAEEIVENHKNGVIVELSNRFDYADGKDDFKDVENLAQSMELLMNNEEMCNKMSLNAQKIINSREKNVIIPQWIELIEK